MILLRIIAALVVASVPLAGCGAHPQRSASPLVSPPILSSAKPQGCLDPTTLPSRDKLAQLLMVGVRNAADARAVVVDHQVGGVFLGSWTDLSMLTDGSLADIARHAAALPLAVSVDEEGGRVSRLASLIGSAPSARVLAQTYPVDDVYRMAVERGRAMRNLGITVDFAPVVDVSDAPADSVIGDRSFSADPAVVTDYAQAYARGLRDAGLLPVLKHFPGHGHGSGDSHTGEVTTPPLDELERNDLVPYRTLVGQAPVGVMIGHMRVPGLTGDQPASLSPAAVQLLRAGSGYGGPPFTGPVFSDDLSSMAAVADHYGVAEAVLRTLQAGIDIALWVTTDQVPAVLDRLVKALAAGELSMPAIDTAVQRVAAMKGPNPRCGR
ncbi:MAG: glycoside hydrolase family 3 protein [Mycobacteriaceae bacterium]|nr:glycoside hydrolase family 3 protein [Mycobacteriaceae bacterium]